MSRPTPTLYQPPLRWWTQTWRLIASALIGLIALLATLVDRTELSPPLERFFLLDLLLGVVALAVVAFRRRWPITVNIVLSLLSGVSLTAGGPAALGLVSLSTRRRWAEILPIAVLALICAEVLLLVNPLEDQRFLFVWQVFVATVAIIAAVVAVGMYLGSRRELLWTLRDRAERAEAEQELRVARAKANERTRIAREMHDVLAHRISLVSMHAGALSYRPDLSEEQRAKTAEVIQDSAHRALVDLRQVLGVLRGDGEPDDHPQPTLREIGDLVADARSIGTKVTYELSVDADAVPEGLGRTAYHVVREGLTNARKHAPGAAVSVVISGGSEDGLTVRVVNPLSVIVGATPGAGLGLVGLTERAELAGGRLMTSRVKGAFELTVWLPWQA